MIRIHIIFHNELLLSISTLRIRNTILQPQILKFWIDYWNINKTQDRKLIHNPFKHNLKLIFPQITCLKINLTPSPKLRVRASVINLKYQRCLCIYYHYSYNSYNLNFQLFTVDECINDKNYDTNSWYVMACNINLYL